MKRLLLYLIVILVSFVVSLLVLAPASTVWQLLKNDVNQALPDLNIQSVTGTIWDGRALLAYRQFPPAYLTWTLDPLGLVGQVIKLQLNLTGDNLKLSTTTNLSSGMITVSNLNGIIDSEFINAASQFQGLTFSGPIELNGIEIVDDFKRVLSASGHISWAGGKIVSQNTSGRLVFELPAIKGDVAEVSGDLDLRIHNENQTLIDIRLKHNGWIIVSLKASLFNLAGLTLPRWIAPMVNTKNDDTVLEFEEKIF